MLWALVWTGLVVAGLALHAALSVRIWRSGKRAYRELTDAADRFSDTSQAVRESFALRYPRPGAEIPVLGDPVALRRARDRRLRIARSRRVRRLAAATGNPRLTRRVGPPH